MKKILLVFTIFLSLLPFGISASEVKYTTLNLDEVLTEEQIEHDFSSYKENDKQITIYLFRGKGCGYCRSFLTFLNSIIDEYGKYFKVVSYETWYNKDNNNLMTKVSNFLEEPADGVPYIIIGDQVFPGYASQYDEQIKKAITDLYNSKDRYDVFKEMEKAEKEANKSVNISYETILIPVLVFIVVGAAICAYLTINQNKKLYTKLEEMENKLKDINDKINASDKKEKVEKVEKTNTTKVKTKSKTKKEK